MTADEIRKKWQGAAPMNASPVDVEIAAQLAELNEKLAKMISNSGTSLRVLSA